MSNSNSLDQFDRQIGAWFSVFTDSYYQVFLLLHNYIFVPLASIDAMQWTYLTAISIAMWLGAYRLSKILPTERCWELFLIRTVLARSLQVFIPASVIIWYSSCLLFAGDKLRPEFAAEINQYLASHAGQFMHGTIAGLVLALVTILLIGKKFEPAISEWLAGRTKSASLENTVQDVSEVLKYLPKAKPFIPEKYFNKARKKQSFFFGLQADNKPTFVNRKQFNECNILIVGPTRTGKGVKAGVVLSQCLSFDDPDIVIAIDPKGDDWGPLVLKKACEAKGLPFRYFNLARGQGVQFNPLQSVSKNDLIPLLVAAYDLSQKGSSDDYYRQLETEAIETIVSQCSDTPTFAELYRLALKLFDDKEIDNIRSLISKLKQDANLTALQTTQGPVFESLLNTGGVFWFVGSEDDPSIIRMQRLIAVRAVQFFRYRDDKSRHGTIFADELKHIVSAQFYKAYSTILGKGNANILSTIQTIGDLVDIPANLDATAVSKTIFDNCAIKWFYRTKDHETVEWIVKAEGTKTVNSSRLNIERNMELAETSASSRTLIEEEVSYLHPNQILHLPDACAVIIGVGIAKIVFTSPIKVEKQSLIPDYLTDKELIEVAEEDDLL